MYTGSRASPHASGAAAARASTAKAAAVIITILRFFDDALFNNIQPAAQAESKPTYMPP